MVTKLLMSAAAPLALASGAPAEGVTAEIPWPVQVRHDLVRLGRVEWRMRRETVQLCRRKAAGIGIVVDDLDAYEAEDRAYVRAAAGLANAPQAIAVMAGSPAEAAGLREGDEILSVNGRRVSELVYGEGEVTMSDAVTDAIAASPLAGTIRLEIVREGAPATIELAPEPLCAGRFILKSDKSVDAYSDGRNIAISTGAVRFTENDDELALVAGHELAHTIIHEGRKAGLFSGKKLEDEADAMGVRLADCAGYDPARSLGFWDRFAKRDWLGFLRMPTHRGPKSRGKRLRAMLPELTCPQS